MIQWKILQNLKALSESDDQGTSYQTTIHATIVITSIYLVPPHYFNYYQHSVLLRFSMLHISILWLLRNNEHYFCSMISHSKVVVIPHIMISPNYHYLMMCSMKISHDYFIWSYFHYCLNFGALHDNTGMIIPHWLSKVHLYYGLVHRKMHDQVMSNDLLFLDWY